MVDFSFLGTKAQEQAIADVPIPEPLELSDGFRFDPNMINLMAGMGSMFSQGKPAGQAIGEPTANMNRAQQYQEAAARQQAEEKNLMRELINAIRGDYTAKMFGDKEDLSNLDSLTIDGNGITVKAPNPFRTQKFGGDKPLEGQNSTPATTSKASAPMASAKDYSPFLQALLA